MDEGNGRGMEENGQNQDLSVTSPRFRLWATRDEMWGSSLRWEMLAEDQDEGGNILSSGKREAKTFLKRNCIYCLFLHKDPLQDLVA